jgi:hypothetical protein
MCRISQAAAVLLCDHIVDLVDVGSGTPTVVLYTGAMPAYCDLAAMTEVATCELDGTAAYGAAAWISANHAAEALLTVTATDPHATGHANPVTHFRILDGDGTAVLQGTCSDNAGDDLVLNADVIVASSEVNITVLTVAVPVNQA